MEREVSTSIYTCFLSYIPCLFHTVQIGKTTKLYLDCFVRKLFIFQDGTCHFKSSAVGATDVGFVDIPEGDEEKLKEAVANNGPVSVAIDASHSSFQMYSSGMKDLLFFSKCYLPRKLDDI